MQLFCLLDLLVRSQSNGSTSDKVSLVSCDLMVATPFDRSCTHWSVVE